MQNHLQQLYSSIEDGDLELFRGLLEEQPARKEKRRQIPSKTPVDNKVDLVNSQDENLWTPLHRAVQLDRPEFVDLLLEKGAITDVMDKRWMTPLHHASNLGRSEIATKLIDGFAIVDCKDNRSRTPMHLAAKSGSVDVIRVLGNAGADPNILDRDYKSPAFYAAQFLDNDEDVIEVFKALEEIGAQFTFKRTKENNPLFPLIQKSFDGAVRFLIERGCRQTSLNSKQQTPLMMAASLKVPKDQEKNRSIIAALVEGHPSSITKCDSEGRSPITEVVRNGDVASLQMLLDQIQEDPSEKLVNRLLLVSAASPGDFIGVFEELLERGADVVASDENGNTCIHLAAERGNTQIAEHCLELGLDPSAVNKKKQTALSLSQDPEFASTMMEKLFDPDTRQTIAETTRRRQEFDRESRASASSRRTQSQVSRSSISSKTKSPAKFSCPKTPESISRAKAWGGSNEADAYRRKVRVQLRELRQTMNDILEGMREEIERLRAAIGEEEDREEEEF